MDGSLDALRAACHADPERHLAPLAHALLRGGEPAEAAAVCERYLAATPSQVAGRVVYGMALRALGRHPEARRAFTEVLRRDPGNTVAARELRALHALQRDAGEMRAEFDAIFGSVFEAPLSESTEVEIPRFLRPASAYSQTLGALVDGWTELPRAAADPAADEPGMVFDASRPSLPAASSVPSSWGHDAFERVLSERWPTVTAAEPRAQRPTDDASADASTDASSAPFATETMARLLLEQGHHGQALAVYETLAAMHPDDHVLRDRVRALRATHTISDDT